MNRQNMIQGIVSTLLLLVIHPGGSNCQFMPWPTIVNRPLCLHQFALVNHACRLLPYSPLPPPSPPPTPFPPPTPGPTPPLPPPSPSSPPPAPCPTPPLPPPSPSSPPPAPCPTPPLPPPSPSSPPPAPGPTPHLPPPSPSSPPPAPCPTTHLPPPSPSSPPPALLCPTLSLAPSLEEEEEEPLPPSPPSPAYVETPTEEECCRWMKSVDSECVCALLAHLPTFLTRPIHQYTTIVDPSCSVTFMCSSTIRFENDQKSPRSDNDHLIRSQAENDQKSPRSP